MQFSSLWQVEKKKENRERNRISKNGRECDRAKTVEKARTETRDSGRWPSSKGRGNAVGERERERGEQAIQRGK